MPAAKLACDSPNSGLAALPSAKAQAVNSRPAANIGRLAARSSCARAKRAEQQWREQHEVDEFLGLAPERRRQPAAAPQGEAEQDEQEIGNEDQGGIHAGHLRSICHNKILGK